MCFDVHFIFKICTIRFCDYTSGKFKQKIYLYPEENKLINSKYRIDKKIAINEKDSIISAYFDIQ